MSTATHTINQLVTPKNWRLRPGYLSEDDSDFESVHVLMNLFSSIFCLARTGYLNH